ncbi:MAG TPA: (deoxy)nucleoside triphosphate pyrophosphohydrolase [Verrucomicrobiota bacterium]|nr:(deoxy)nucleoside triphosphate pyrophosphohydrolase [Verrucomicrobiota bacterium]
MEPGLWTFPMTPPVMEVAAALVFRAGRLLVTQRPAGRRFAGLWEFPGGKREAGETWEACLRREIREELACDIEVGPAFDEVRHPEPDKTLHLRFFLARLTAGEPQPVECAAVAWVAREELPNLSFPPADTTLLARLAREWPAEPPREA